MAKKKEDSIQYLQMPLPKSRKHYKMTKRSWSGLNKRHIIDTGALSMEKNISTQEAPYLVPSQSLKVFTDNYAKHAEQCRPIGLFGFDDFLIIIYRKITSGDSAILIDHITVDEDGDLYMTYSGKLKASGATREDEYPRCVVQFNVYDTPTDPVSGKYVKKLLVFPDKKSMDFEIPDGDFTVSDMDVLIKEYENDVSPYLPPDSASHNYYYKNTSDAAQTADELYGTAIYRWVDDESDETNSGWKISMPPTMPDIKYATVHLSRLFGVDEDRVYASGFNNYANWNLDTIEEYNESNAWCSPAQSNTKAGGVFTGITTYQGHIVCFKRDFMHEIYNTKNPFRIQDIYAEGAIDNRTIQDVDGKLIFVSEDNVKIYTGSNPRIISYYLGLDSITHAVSGTDGKNYYLYCENANGDKQLLTYDTLIEQWSEQSIEQKVIGFAHNKTGMYMLCEDGIIYKMDSGEYEHSWSFETDLITNETVDIKHIKKLQMLADIHADAEMKIYVLYDNEVFDENTSHLVYKSSGYGKKPIRVKLRQTANYGIKLHIEGFGYVRLYELELFMESGGDLYV